MHEWVFKMVLYLDAKTLAISPQSWTLSTIGAMELEVLLILLTSAQNVSLFFLENDLANFFCKRCFCLRTRRRTFIPFLCILL